MSTFFYQEEEYPAASMRLYAERKGWGPVQIQQLEVNEGMSDTVVYVIRTKVHCFPDQVQEDLEDGKVDRLLADRNRYCVWNEPLLRLSKDSFAKVLLHCRPFVIGCLVAFVLRLRKRIPFMLLIFAFWAKTSGFIHPALLDLMRTCTQFFDGLTDDGIVTDDTLDEFSKEVKTSIDYATHVVRRVNNHLSEVPTLSHLLYRIEEELLFHHLHPNHPMPIPKPEPVQLNLFSFVVDIQEALDTFDHKATNPDPQIRAGLMEAQTVFQTMIAHHHRNFCSFCKLQLPTLEKQVCCCKGCNLNQYCDSRCTLAHLPVHIQTCTGPKVTCAACQQVHIRTPEVGTCGKCLNTHYCNRDCQRMHWRTGGHRETCPGQPVS